MKIIFCLNSFLPNQVGGTEVYTLSLATELQKNGNTVMVLIPNFGQDENKVYVEQGIKVICYAENSTSIPNFLKPNIPPKGLRYFVEFVKNEKPDIVHFQDITQNNGISLYHIKAIKKLGIKVIMTFHLAGYSCKTGNLMYMNKNYCNGKVDIEKCTWCCFTDKDISRINKNILFGAAKIFYSINYDTRKWNSTLGTGLAFLFVIDDYKKTLKEISDNCDYLVTLTQWYKKILLINDISEQKIKYIPQGLSFSSINSIQSLNSTKLKMLFVGRVARVKGLKLLIEVITKISPELISLDIFGQPTELDYYAECKNISNEFENIRWNGIIKSKMMVEKMKEFNVLCLPSEFSEMSPLVIQEAHAAGLPVIASNVYGNAEQIIDGVNGWLFNFKDSIDLSIIINKLINFPELIENAKENIPIPRSFDLVAADYEKLYRETLLKK